MLDLLKLALRNIGRHRGRTAMTVASVAFGVVALILAGGFIEDTIVETGESMIHSNSGHLQVGGKGYWARGAQEPEKFLTDRLDPLRDSIRADPQIDDVMLRIGFAGLLGNGRTDWSIVGEGVESDREARMGSYMTLVAGKQLTANEPYGMMIGAGVSEALKVSPGDTVTLLVSAAGGATNLLEFRVTGVFRTFSKDYDARAVRINLASAGDLLATSGAHVAVIVLRETRATDRVAARLAAALPDSLELRTWREINDFYRQTVDLYERQFGFLQLIIMVMLLLSVSNAIHMAIFERVSEFGTMRAIGNNSARVFALVVAESCWLGLLGSTIGVVAGILLALVISRIGIPMPPPPNADMGYTSRVLVVPAIVATSFLIGLAAAALASLHPAYRVSRMDIPEALRQGV